MGSYLSGRFEEEGDGGTGSSFKRIAIPRLLLVGDGMASLDESTSLIASYPMSYFFKPHRGDCAEPRSRCCRLFVKLWKGASSSARLHIILSLLSTSNSVRLLRRRHASPVNPRTSYCPLCTRSGGSADFSPKCSATRSGGVPVSNILSACNFITLS
jgi:hypothetical protein